MRDQIWAILNNSKFKGYCLGYLVDKLQKWDRNINIFLAVVSSGSIAAWAIWKAYPMVWGGIIALSQVMTAIKPYFPFFKYVKELNAKCLKVDNLNIEFEKLWDQVYYKKITDDQATEKYFALQAIFVEIFTFGDDTIFDTTKDIVRKANESMKIFLKTRYKKIITINK